MLGTRSLVCRRRCRPACARWQEIAGMTWTEVKLGDAIHVKHGFAFKGQFFTGSGTHVVLTPGNFNEGGGFRLRPGKDRFYSGDIPEEYILKEDDLIVAMTEQGPGLLGSSALIPESGRYLHNQRLGLVQIRDDTAFDTRFLYYLFNTRLIREQINGSATGTKVRHTAPERIYRVTASVPSNVEEQRKIVQVLSSYDDLIENNRRRIHLLEHAARLLYKEWFVHFRFPGHQRTTIISGIPKGWMTKPFSKLATFLNGFAFKPSHFGNTGLPVVKIPELRNGPTKKTPRNTGEDVPECYVIGNGDVIFSWSGTLLVRIWNHGNALLNKHLFKVNPISNIPREFIYLSLNYALVNFQNQTTGSTMKHIRKNALDNVFSLLPNTATLNKFEVAIYPMFEQIGVLQRQANEAMNARDLLLPRLMSGEVTV